MNLVKYMKAKTVYKGEGYNIHDNYNFPSSVTKYCKIISTVL